MNHSNPFKLILVFSILLSLSFTLMAKGKSDKGIQSDETKKLEKTSPIVMEENKTDTMESTSWENVVEGQLVQINGILRRIGSEPLSSLVIKDSASKDWFISNDSELILESYEQKHVSIQANVTLKKMVLANGRVLGTRRILVNVTIVE